MTRLLSMFSHKSNRLKELKMKRLLSIFSLAAMLLLGLAIPHAAIAAVTCTAIPGTGSIWPGSVYTQKCGADTSADNADALFGGVNETATGSGSGQPRTLLMNSMISLFAHGAPAGGAVVAGSGKGFFGVVYLFHNPADYHAWTAANKVIDVATTSGLQAVTAIDSKTFQAMYTAVFEVSTNGLMNSIVIGGNTSHEIGHWMDYLIEKQIDPTNKLKLLVVSNQPLFNTLIENDWSNLAQNGTVNEACTDPNSNAPGIFTGEADAHALTGPNVPARYICGGVKGTGTTVSSTYTGQAGFNKAILQKAWNQTFTPGQGISPTIPNSELWAEGLNATLGNTDAPRAPSWQDIYIGADTRATPASFQCVAAFISYVGETALLPSPTNKPSDWPTNCPLD
jgi:hypothetical protein